MWHNPRATTLRKKLLPTSLLAGLCLSVSGGLHAESLEEVFQLAKQNDALLKSQAAQAAAGRETGNIYKAQLLPQAALNASKSRSKNDMQGYRCSGTGMGGEVTVRVVYDSPKPSQ